MQNTTNYFIGLHYPFNVVAGKVKTLFKSHYKRYGWMA